MMYNHFNNKGMGKIISTLYDKHYLILNKL